MKKRLFSVLAVFALVATAVFAPKYLLRARIAFLGVRPSLLSRYSSSSSLKSLTLACHASFLLSLISGKSFLRVSLIFPLNPFLVVNCKGL